MYGLLVPAGGGEPLPLLKPTVIVGRRPECDVVIASRSVSGQHCRLEFVDDVWQVVDLDSQNGTGIDGRRCRKAKILPGQVLHVAKQRFHIDYPDPNQRTREADDLALEFLLGSGPAVDPLSSLQSAAQHYDGIPGQQQIPSTAAVPQQEGQAAVPSGPMGTLLPAGGGQPIPLTGTSLILGRSRRCDVRIQSSTISSRHCRLDYVNGHWVVEDLESSNGIRVDGIRFRRKCVMPGSELSLSRESFMLEYIPGDGVPPVAHEPYNTTGSVSRNDSSGSLLDKVGISRHDVAGIQKDENAVPDQKIYSLEDDDE